MSGLKLFLALNAVMWPTLALADCVDSGDGRAACLGPVKTLYSSDSALSFVLYGDVASLPCASASTVPGWWRIERTHPRYREWYSFLLTATAANATVYVVSEYANGNAVCDVQRIEWRN